MRLIKAKFGGEFGSKRDFPNKFGRWGSPRVR